MYRSIEKNSAWDVGIFQGISLHVEMNFSYLPMQPNTFVMKTLDRAHLLEWTWTRDACVKSEGWVPLCPDVFKWFHCLSLIFSKSSMFQCIVKRQNMSKSIFPGASFHPFLIKYQKWILSGHILLKTRIMTPRSLFSENDKFLWRATPLWSFSATHYLECGSPP